MHFSGKLLVNLAPSPEYQILSAFNDKMHQIRLPLRIGA